jgi:hypothetical protein
MFVSLRGANSLTASLRLIHGYSRKGSEFYKG